MNNFYSNNDEIDLRDLLNSLIRRKIFLLLDYWEVFPYQYLKF